MNRFNYLREPLPNVFTAIRYASVPQLLAAPLVAVITTMTISLGAWGIDAYRADLAYRAERVALARAEESHAELARTSLERTDAETLLTLDRRLRAIRGSGPLLARRLADLANHVPSRTWLTSIARTPSGVSLSGRATDLNALGNLMADVLSSKATASAVLVRAGREAATSRVHELWSFEVRVVDRPL